MKKTKDERWTRNEKWEMKMKMWLELALQGAEDDFMDRFVKFKM